jgi:hypothetical protein
MLTYKGILIQKGDSYFATIGISGLIGHELKIPIGLNTEHDYIIIVEYLIDYIFNTQPTITSGQTISYYSWLLKFVDQDGYLEIWEASNDGTIYSKGADHSIRIKNEQDRICLIENVKPLYPSFNQKIAISQGVYDGLPINGVRYPSPLHMTGWWLTTDLYNDKIESLMVVHFYHVAFKRADILPYLALPNGFRFYIGHNDVSVRFDNEVASQEQE